MMSRKTRNELVYEENKQLITYKETSDKEIKRSVTHKLKNNWNDKTSLNKQLENICSSVDRQSNTNCPRLLKNTELNKIINGSVSQMQASTKRNQAMSSLLQNQTSFYNDANCSRNHQIS
mmetsp:Transcript_18187/g.27981  ORF Transcript_18187/g.27981 Transcript_18187/m.27981 type:complete len:120 (-) Transcript_18187:4098-4457(-)